MPILIVLKGDEEIRRYPFVREKTVLGRDPTCDIVLPSGNVSRRHARIEYANGNFTLYSTSGTKPMLIAGREKRFAVLDDASQFQLGEYTLRFASDGGPAPETLERVKADRIYRPKEDDRTTNVLSPEMLEAIEQQKKEEE